MKEVRLSPKQIVYFKSNRPMLLIVYALRPNIYGLRNHRDRVPPKARTVKFSKSFIPWSIRTFK